MYNWPAYSGTSYLFNTTAMLVSLQDYPQRGSPCVAAFLPHLGLHTFLASSSAWPSVRSTLYQQIHTWMQKVQTRNTWDTFCPLLIAGGSVGRGGCCACFCRENSRMDIYWSFSSGKLYIDDSPLNFWQQVVLADHFHYYQLLAAWLVFEVPWYLQNREDTWLSL